MEKNKTSSKEDAASARQDLVLPSPILSPPIDANGQSDEGNDSGSINLDGLVSTGTVGFRGVVIQETTTTEFFSRLLPDPAELKAYKEVYAKAPQMIFDDFREQATHRRETEKSEVACNQTLALRGQVVAAILAIISIIGCFWLLGNGKRLEGAGAFFLAVAPILGLFLYMDRKEDKEKKANRDLLEKMNKGVPIERLEEEG